MEAQSRAGIFDGGQHQGGEDIPISLIDTKKRIIVEGGEFNFPEWVQNDTKTYTFTGTNYEVIEKLFDLIGEKWDKKVTHVKSGDIIICIRSAFDNAVRTYTGTITQILSAINESCGCKHVESGATMTNHDTGETVKMGNAGKVGNDFANSEKNRNFGERITPKHIQDVISGKSKVSHGEAINSASSYLRGSESPSSHIKGSKLHRKEEAERLKSYIADNNLWFSVEHLKNYLDEGAEQQVYLIDEKHVIKTNDSIFYSSWQDYLHSLLLHNYFFPDTAYELIGFTEKDNVLLAVVKQRYVKKKGNTDLEHVKKFMAENGFKNTKDNDYYNPELGLILEDLHDENVLTKDGILYFVDTVFYISDNIKKRGGKNSETKITKDELQSIISGESKVSNGDTIQSALPYIRREEGANSVNRRTKSGEEERLNKGGKVPELNSKGGYDYKGDDRDIAKTVGLLTLPKAIKGTNCSNCLFYLNDYCYHEDVQLPVTSRMCCALWDSKTSLKAWVAGADNVVFKKLHPVEEYPLNDRGGLDYSGEGLQRAQDADLVTLPPDIIGTNCAFKNCRFTDKNDFCTHPKILLPVTPRMSCSLWDNEEAMRSWKGEATEILYKDGEPVIDWKATKGMDKQVMLNGGRIAQGYINAPYTKLVKILGEPNVKSEKDKIGWFMAIDKNHIGAVWTEADKSVKQIIKEKYHKWFVWGANDESQRRLYDALGFQVRDVDPVKQKEKEKAISIKRWVKKREHIQELSNNTQKIRLKTTNDLKSEDEKEFLTALVVKVMDKTAERVGNCDSEDDGHFGVTGLQKRHIKIGGNEVSLSYVGKSNVAHKKLFSDKRIAKALKKAIKNSPSEFIFTTTDGKRIKCDRVNRYLSPFKVTAKDIRGYSANKWIIERLERETPKLELEGLTEEQAQKKRKAVFNKAVKETAKDVGHGASTLKKHYMIPELADEYIQRGHIIDMKKLGYYHNGGGVEGEGTEKKYHYLEDITSPYVPVTSYFFNPNEAPKIVEEASMMIADQAETQDEVYAIWEKFPTKEIPFSLIYPMQDDMNAKNIEELNELIQKGNIPTRKAYAIEYEGKYYLNDGHHRAIALYLNDKPIVAHVYEIKNDYQQNIIMKNIDTSEVVDYLKHQMNQDKQEYKGHIPNEYSKGMPWNDSSWFVSEIMNFLNKGNPYSSYTLQKFRNKYNYETLNQILKENFKSEYERAEKLLTEARGKGGSAGQEVTCVCFSEYLEQQHPQLHERVMNGNMETDSELRTEFNEVQEMYHGGKPSSYKNAGKANEGELITVQHIDKSWGIHRKAEEGEPVGSGEILGVIGHAGMTWNTTDSKALAQKIVKSVNMHDELVGVLKDHIQSVEEDLGTTSNPNAMSVRKKLERYKQLLKQAQDMYHGGKPSSYQEAGKITEGDWIKQDSEIKVNDGKAIPIVTDKGTPLAYVLKNKFVDGNANANLIASAKTLYETLKMAIWQVNEFWRLSQDLKGDPEKNKKLFDFAISKLETIRTSGTDALKQAEGK